MRKIIDVCVTRVDDYEKCVHIASAYITSMSLCMLHLYPKKTMDIIM